MADYNSILKEKKKYEEPIKENTGPKPFPWLKMDVFSIIIILIVSYIVYYINILTPELIFLNDLNTLTKQYETLLQPLNLDQFENDYNIEGIITIEEQEYNYEIVKNENKFKTSLSLDDNKLDYYATESTPYIKLSSFKEEYIKLSTNDYSNILSNLKDYFTNNLPKDKFIKKFYLNGTTPTVESNLHLTNEDILKALKLNNLENSYEVLFTFKNNAITNEIISMKITINNLNTQARSVITYENNLLYYKDDNQSLELKLEQIDENFTLKISKEGTLYSVLTGSRLENSYKYLYQIIDKIYNISLTINNENNINSYEVESNIEKGESTINQKLMLTFQKQDDIILENTEIANALDYNKLTEEEQKQYQASLEELTGSLRQFIDKHKDSID